MNKPLSLFLAALLLGGQASAQQSAPATVADSGFYFGVDIGTVMMLKDRSAEIAALIDREKGASSVAVEQSSGTTTVRLFGGHVINRNVASELGLVVTAPLGVYVSGIMPAVPPAPAESFSQNGSISFYGLDASVLFRPYPYPSRPFPYKLLSGISLRAGGHFMITNSDLSDYPLATANGGGLLYGFNFDWPLGDGLFRVGYTKWNDIAGVAGNSGPVLTLGYLWRL